VNGIDTRSTTPLTDPTRALVANRVQPNEAHPPYLRGPTDTASIYTLSYPRAISTGLVSCVINGDSAFFALEDLEGAAACRLLKSLALPFPPAARDSPRELRRRRLPQSALSGRRQAQHRRQRAGNIRFDRPEGGSSNAPAKKAASTCIDQRDS
jgi:hypothetical protein